MAYYLMLRALEVRGLAHPCNRSHVYGFSPKASNGMPDRELRPGAFCSKLPVIGAASG